MKMSKSGINMGKVAIGGAVAGVVMFVLEGVINTFMKADWTAWKNHAATAFTLPEQSMSLTYWALQSLVLGFCGMWIYAAARTRLSPGPRTAVCTGLVVWAISWLGGFLNESAVGVMPLSVSLGNCVFGVVASVAAITAGAWRYAE